MPPAWKVSRSPPRLAACRSLFAIMVLLSANPVASVQGQGTVGFRNYYWRFDGTNLSREDRPIYLSDGVTRASGSNYVVELLALDPFTRQPEFVSQTHLLQGDEAGLFDGGYLALPFIALGANAVIEIRAWDLTTGHGYETAVP